MKYYKVRYDGEVVCEVWARDEHYALLKARRYLMATGRLFDVRRVSVA